MANANLCYYLWERGDPRDKDEALRSGKLAADHAGEFESRDSFLINYATAWVGFSLTYDELVPAVAFTVRLHERSLDAQERKEVNDALLLGIGRLRELESRA